MADNPLKKLVSDVKSSGKPKRASKSNRTHYLLEPQYSVFARYHKVNDLSPSDTLDKLIAMFLEEVKDELPPDISFKEGA